MCLSYLNSRTFSNRLAPNFCSLWISIIWLLVSLSNSFFFFPDLFMGTASRFFSQYIQTLFTVEMLTFISAAILLVLLLLILFRIMYLIFLLVSFIALLHLPMNSS